MATSPIDLSSGFVPKARTQPAQNVDLSAGFVPKAPSQASRAVPDQQGLLSSFADTSGLSMLGSALRHPLDTVSTVLDAGKQVFTPANMNVPISQSSNPLLKAVGQQVDYTKQHARAAVSDFQHGGMKNPQLGEDVMKAIPFAGGVYDKATSQADAGNTGGAVGTLLGLGAGLAGPELAARGLQAVVPAVTHPLETLASPLRSRLDEPLPGTSLTPRARYASAKNLGVQLDAADATNHPLLNGAKVVNQHSLMGAPAYEATRAKNLAQLNNSTDTMLHQMSPVTDLQGRGSLVQDALRANQQGLHTDANEGFQRLDEMTAHAPVPGASDVGLSAQAILEGNQAFQTKYPSFTPNTAVSALRDLSKVGDTASYSELQRLRSNVLELTRANPDVVKDEGTGWLQRAEQSLDSAITDKGLTPDQADVFRASNAKYKDMKATYDDPQSPYYTAVRKAAPESLAGGVGGPNATSVQNLFPRISPEAQGAVQRTVAEKLLGTNATGDPRFQGFGTRLYAQPEGYRDALFSPDQNRTLTNIADTTHALNADLNPSGSGKLLHKVGDMSALASSGVAALSGHVAPLVGDALYNGAQYGLSKLINSPRVTDFLMKDPGALSGGGSARLPALVPPGGTPGPTSSGAGLKPLPGAASALSGLYRSSSADGLESLYGKPVTPNASGVGLDGLEGADTQLLTPNGSLPAKYRVVEADSLVPSHDARTFKANPDYPEGVQERDYGQKENQLRVIANAQNYKPALTVTDSPDGINGPPVTTPDGKVLGGNSRTMTLQRLYGQDGSAYKQALAKKAASFGLSPDDINGMRKPVLVREVSPDGGVDGMRRLATALNKPLTGSMGASEKAVSMGKSISPETLNSVQAMLDEAGKGSTLRDVMSDPAKANNFLQKMQKDGIITAAERPQYVDSGTGGMTSEGKNLFERALLGAAVGDTATMEAAPKNILSKLGASIGPISRLAARGDEFNILPEIRAAIREHGKMAVTGMNVDDHFAQRGMFHNAVTPAAEQMARVLAKNPNTVREALGSFAKDARQSPEGQSSLLGMSGPSAEDAWIKAFGPILERRDAPTVQGAPVVPLQLRAKPNGTNVSALLARPGVSARLPAGAGQARAALPLLGSGLRARVDAA